MTRLLFFKSYIYSPFKTVSLKKQFVYILGIIFLLTWSSCREDFEFEPSSGNLIFERDTVYLDTVFTNIGSSTYNLKVYNRSNTDIVIPSIQLEQGSNSFYRLNVDGTTGLEGEQQGKYFENVELLAQDSLFIFIETTVDIEQLSQSDTQFLYTDRILFDSGSNEQDVDLVTLVKDAVFIFPNKDPNTGIIETLSFDIDGDGNAEETQIQGRFLGDDELLFTNEKPYVIYGYAAVDRDKTLVMEAGARVYFHRDSGLLVTSGGSLNINGELSTDPELLENEVILAGNRLEPFFEDIPGQWGTIWLFNDSEDNEINYTTIKNATVGILSEGNDQSESDKLLIRNSQIYNSSAFGVLGRATSISAENLVINNSGQASFAGVVGGRYSLTHCTIANYWNNSFRDFPALFFNDFIQVDETSIATNPMNFSVSNTIVYGNDNPEFLLVQQGDNFDFKFSHCLLRFNNANLEGNPNYDFNNPEQYLNNVFNENPEFEAPFENRLKINESSGANGIADPTVAAQVPFDITNTARGASPDAGAYESSEQPSDN